MSQGRAIGVWDQDVIIKSIAHCYHFGSTINLLVAAAFNQFIMSHLMMQSTILCEEIKKVKFGTK